MVRPIPFFAVFVLGSFLRSAVAMPVIFHRCTPWGDPPPAGVTLANPRLIYVAPGMLLGKVDRVVRAVAPQGVVEGPQLGRSFYFKFQPVIVHWGKLFLRSEDGHLGLVGTIGAIAIEEPFHVPHEVVLDHGAHLGVHQGRVTLVTEIHTDELP